MATAWSTSWSPFDGRTARFRRLATVTEATSFLSWSVDQGDSRGVFAVAAAVFNRPDFAWAAEGAAPELLWLMGGDGLRAFDALHPAPPSDEARPGCFRPADMRVMRSGWAPDAHQMIVDVGPLGCPTSSGHGHADLLSVQCSIFGEPCLVDAGTYCYTAEPVWRDFFREHRRPQHGARRRPGSGTVGRTVSLASAPACAAAHVAVRSERVTSWTPTTTPTSAWPTR